MNNLHKPAIPFQDSYQGLTKLEYAAIKIAAAMFAANPNATEAVVVANSIDVATHLLSETHKLAIQYEHKAVRERSESNVLPF